ncbi:hypothetical protein TNCV_1373091 [Trichonephila clavipes]|uniref:Uncharacterized protein n=1 Tax=Trichonephila clavipes TaxID=2585209 RepID=A0A8X6WGM8_TRICX|nr:hypothetical protein TNCV_1373091 [Trichonephila clavipes]
MAIVVNSLDGVVKSRVQVLVPMKTRCVEGLMQEKSVEAQNLHNDMNCRASSPPVRLVKRDAPENSQDVVPQNLGETEQNRTVTCMVLEAKANDRRKDIALRHDEFRGP